MAARTRWKLADTIDSAIKYEHLMTEHRSSLESRMAAGFIEDFSADLGTLRGKQRATADARSDKKASTKTNRQKLAEAAGIAAVYRNSVRSHFGDDEAVQQMFGIGEDLNARSSQSVAGALEILKSACEENTVIARAAAILPEDVELIGSSLQALTGSHEDKVIGKADSVKATKDRDAAHFRVEAAITKTYAVATIVFREQPETLALFTAALPAPRGKARRKKASEVVEPTPT